MAPPLHAWRQYPRNANFNPNSPAAKRANTGFTSPPLRRAQTKTTSRRLGTTLKWRVGTKGLVAAAGAVPVLAGLGTLLGTLLGKRPSPKTKTTTTQEGSGVQWRVAAHQPFLLGLTTGDAWGRTLRQANSEQLRAVTDVIRNLSDGVVPVPTDIKLPLKKHKREIRRLSVLSTPLYERRALLLSLGKRLVPFVLCKPDYAPWKHEGPQVRQRNDLGTSTVGRHTNGGTLDGRQHRTVLETPYAGRRVGQCPSRGSYDEDHGRHNTKQRSCLASFGARLRDGEQRLLQPLTVKSMFTDNKIAPKRSSRAPPLQGPKSTRPPMGHSFQEAIQRTQTIDQDLEAFRTQAKEDLAAAVKTGNDTQIHEAQQRLAIVDRNIEEIKAQDDELDQLELHYPSKDNQDIYGEEDETDWREDKRKNLARTRDQRYCQLKHLYPQMGQFALPPSPPSSPHRESSRPPSPKSFEEAVARSDAIERELQGFRTRAEDALARAERTGNKADIKKAKQRLAIVNWNVDEIQDTDRKIDRLGYSNEAHRRTYGEDDDKARRQETLKSWEDRRDTLHRQLQKLFHKQRGRGRVWFKPRGWVQE